MSDDHLYFMRRALLLARKGIGRTSPNPAVGCVVVQEGRIVGEGWHHKAGTPHAEIHALRSAGERAHGADLYVTLEPCSHFGRTPPCADAVIDARLGRVFVGMADPNPKVSGRGLVRLRSAGIEVKTGLLEAECQSINRPFIKHMTTGLPFVTLKSAVTLDGKTATACGDSRWVTGEAARRMVHRLRGISDAIMVGIGTVLADDPQLTCREVRGRDPLRIIVDSRLRIPLTAQVLHLSSRSATLIATVSHDNNKHDSLRKLGADLIVCRESCGRVDLHDLLLQLGARGVQSILLEGGALLAGTMLRERLIDRCLFFMAPKLVGGEGTGLFGGSGVRLMAEAIQLRDLGMRRIGEDILIEGEPEYGCLPV